MTDYNTREYKDILTTMSSDKAIRELIINGRAMDNECKNIIASVIISKGNSGDAYNYAHFTGLHLEDMLEVIMKDWRSSVAAMWLKYINNTPELFIQFKIMAVVNNAVPEYINLLNTYKLSDVKINSESFYCNLPVEYAVGVIL